MSHESLGKSDEWYTPHYIFEALDCIFDLDVAPARYGQSFVPSISDVGGDGLAHKWTGFVWMNPPFGGRNGLIPWLDKFFYHGNGIALTPDRTSAPWWQDAANKADAILMVSPKVRFVRPDGSTGNSPSNGTTLFASGEMGVQALQRARKLGVYLEPQDKGSDEG